MVRPKQAGTTAGLPRPIKDHAISQNFHQLIAQVDKLRREQESSGLPRFLWFDSVLNPDGTVDATVRVDDPGNLPGILRAWTNRESYDSPDVEGAVEGLAEVVVTPATILSAQLFETEDGPVTLLKNIMVPAASGKRIFLEFVNEDGLSTGVQDFVLVGSGGVVAPGGELKPGAITARDQFAASVQPIEIVNELPPTCTQNQIVVLATEGKLYRCTGSGWVPVVRAPDLSGVLTAEQLEEEIISTAHFAQGIRPVRLVNGLPGVGDVDGDVVYNTADKMLYRWNSSTASWTTAVKTPDLSGLLSGSQLADLAVSSAKLADLAVINAKMGNTAITNEKVASATLIGGNIQGGTITSSLVQSRTMAADRIASNVLTTNELQAGGVHGDRITGTTLTGDRMVANTVDFGQIATGAIRADEIAAGEVNAGKLAANSVYATNIAAEEVTAAKIAAFAIDVGHIVATGITASWLAVDSVTAAKIQAGAIGVDHINARRMSSPDNTVGIYFADPLTGPGGIPGTWQSYISFTTAGWFLYSTDRFRVGHNGESYIKGKLTIDAGLANNDIEFYNAATYLGAIDAYDLGGGTSGIELKGNDGGYIMRLWGNSAVSTVQVRNGLQVAGFSSLQGGALFDGGFNGAGRPSITGSRGGSVALANLLNTLASYGLVVNNTTA